MILSTKLFTCWIKKPWKTNRWNLDGRSTKLAGLKFRYLSERILVMSTTLLLNSISWSNPIGYQCHEDLNQYLDKQVQRLESTYRKLDPDNFQSIFPENRPQFIPGNPNHPENNNKVVLLIHGFMGTPQEMQRVANPLVEKGFSAYLGLIPGFAGTAKIANQYSYKVWQKWLSIEMEQLKSCFDQIYLVGFSTGGLLIHDYLMTHDDLTKIKGASLLSPYFETSGIFNTVVQKTASTILNEFSTELVYKLFGFPEVEVMLKRPQNYLQSVPLKTTQEIVALGKINQRYKAEKPLPVPNMTLVSDNDQLIDIDVANKVTYKNFITRYWDDYGSSRFFSREKRVPHHIMCPEVSPVADTVRNKVDQFVTELSTL